MARWSKAVLIGVLACAVSPVAAQPSTATWLHGSIDGTVHLAIDAARREGPDALAKLAFAASLHDEASDGLVVRELRRASSRSPVGTQARWLADALTPDAAPPGLVRDFVVIGPFHDPGGGLEQQHGPELPAHDFVTADYSWGAYRVTPRRTMRESATAAGLPLGLYVSPRTETCSYLFSALETPERVTVHVAAAGSVRLLWDGHTLATSAEQQPAMMFDRIAADVRTTAGSHLLGLKVCSSARPDSGRVRVWLSTSVDGLDQPLDIKSSSDPATLQSLWPSSSSAPDATRVTTLLESALARTASRTDALAAALVRRLAGAEDQSSPQAPGLLDRVATGGSPEELALVGYVAPFAAKQSAWLHAAWKGGDGAIASFAQRALVKSRLRGGHVELADATLRQAPLSGDNDIQRRWLAAETQARLGTGTLRIEALQTLLGLIREPDAPLAVWDSVANRAERTLPTEALSARRHLAARLATERGSAHARALELLGGDQLESFVAAHRTRQYRSSDLVAMGSMLLSAGRWAGAHELFAFCSALSPNHADAHLGLARAAFALGDQAAGTASLERARELRPHDPAIAAELKLRAGDTEPTQADDLRFVSNKEQFLARRKQGPDWFARTLLWRRVVQFHPDQRVSQLVQYAREIQVEPRSEAERYEALPFRGRHTELLTARVHRKDGSIHPPEEQDSTGPTIRWPELERGDVVEVVIRQWTAGPVGRRGDAPFYFIDYVGSSATHPVAYNEVIVDKPATSPLHIDVVRGSPDRKQEQRHADRTITRLIWDNPPVIPQEPFAPRASETLPMVVGSIYGDWGSFLTWYRGAIAGFTEPDDQIRRLAAELTADKPERADKIDALFNYVADDIRYVNFVSGEWWLPNRPQQLLARRQGDCDDKAMLLISLLDAVGVEATAVLLQTRMTAQPSVFDSRIAIPMFDHGIIYLPKEDRFLDATSPQHRTSSLPAMDGGARALLVEPAFSGIRTIPRSLAHGVDARWTVTVSEGSAELHAREHHQGDPALLLRSNLGEADSRAQWLERRLRNANSALGWLPSAIVDDDVTFESQTADGRTLVDYRARSHAFGQREGSDIVIALARPGSISGDLAPLRERKLPVVLPPYLAPRQYRLELTLIAPPSHRFAEPPVDATHASPFGAASLRFSTDSDGKQLTMVRLLSFERERIEVADYAAWRTWLQRVDTLLAQSVRLTAR